MIHSTAKDLPIASAGPRDLLSRAWARAVWALAGVAVIAGFFAEAWRPAFWFLGFGMSGVLCVANAVRSKRFHCAFTGPLLLVGAALTVTRALGLHTLGWMAIGVGVVLGFSVPVMFEIVSGRKRIGRCC